MRAKASAISKNVQQSIAFMFTDGASIAVVDLERVVLVGRAGQRPADGRGALADRERSPIRFARLANEPLETVLAFEDGREWKRLRRAAR